MVMNVSLCGPHSFDTSTLVPTLSEVVAPPVASAPLLAMYWYLSPQVGLWVLLCCVIPCAEKLKTAIRDTNDKRAFRWTSIGYSFSEAIERNRYGANGFQVASREKLKNILLKSDELEQDSLH